MANASLSILQDHAMPSNMAKTKRAQPGVQYYQTSMLVSMFAPVMNTSITFYRTIQEEKMMMCMCVVIVINYD